MPGNRSISLIGLLVSVILGNLVPVFTKMLYKQGWQPVALYFATMLIVCAVLCVHEFLSLEKGEKWKMDRKDLFGTVMASVTGGVLEPYLFFTGLSLIAASQAILISSLLPVFVVLLAVILLKEKLNAKMVFGGLIIIAGILLARWQDIITFNFNPGVFFLVGSSFFAALTTIIHKKYVRHRYLDSVVFVRTLFSLFFLGIWILIADPAAFDMLWVHQNVWVFLSLPVAGFILPYFLYFNSLRKVTVADAGMMMAAGKMFGIIMAALILGEKLENIYLISAALVVTGVIIINVPLTRLRIIPSRLPDIGPLRK